MKNINLFAKSSMILCGVGLLGFGACGETNNKGADSGVIEQPNLCLADQRVLSHVCVACPPGTRSEQGADATGVDTECQPVVCSENSHVVSNACLACPSGTTNEAGDDASGSDTNCDALRCLANEFVSAHRCLPCSPGSTNEAGNDASGDNTSCDVTICDANEYVSNHECEPCIEGFVNEAGDVATLGETSCDLDLASIATEGDFNAACLSAPFVEMPFGGPPGYTIYSDGTSDLSNVTIPAAGAPLLIRTSFQT